MITLFDLFKMMAALGLAAVGGSLGWKAAGWMGGILGGGVGLIFGVFLGGLPWKLTVWRTRRELSTKPTDQLLSELREHRTLMPNFILLELAARGHDIRAEMPVILDLLGSQEFHRRTRGWAAMCTAFPATAGEMKSYSPAHPVERCRAEVQRIQQALTASA
jgi:hypothetical protein